MVLAAAFAAVIAIGGTFAYFASRGARPPDPVSTKPAASAQIQIRISAEPTGATLSVDGRTLDGNPAALTLAGDTLDHEVRATLSGYETYKKAVHFDRDLSLEIMLQPVAAVPAPSESTDGVIVSPKPTVPAQVNSKPSPKKAAKTNCDPPFIYENGIKTFKPGCL